MILSVGGWDKGGEGFSKLVSSRENMLKFTKWVIIYLRRHDFDGLDFDWQFPALRDSHLQDKKKFADLCDVSIDQCFVLLKEDYINMHGNS
jgi:chitinase